MKLFIVALMSAVLAGPVVSRTVNISILMPDNDPKQIDNQIAEIVIRTGAYFKIVGTNTNTTEQNDSEITSTIEITPKTTTTIPTALTISDEEREELKNQVLKAAEEGDLSAIKSLIEKGADINAQKESNGYSLLHWACYNGRLDIVKYLIEHGADINVLTNGDDTALHEAAYYGHLDIVEYLLEHGVNVDVKSKDGWTALHKAPAGGVLDIVKTIVEHGADITIKDNEGATALHWAARRDKMDMVKYLVKKGADILSRDYQGQTVIDTAYYWGNIAVAQWLEKQK